MNPIYQPKGKAKEYGDLALNIYTGCPHRCYYCFAPNVLHKDREQFHSCVEPRKNIVEQESSFTYVLPATLILRVTIPPLQEKLLNCSKIAAIMFRYLQKATE